jgi:hypothetical protein
MPYEAHRTGHSFLAFWGPKSTHSHGFGRLYYGAGVSYGEMGSLAGPKSTHSHVYYGPFWPSSSKNFVPYRPVKYADRPALCADCPAMWPDRPTLYSDCLAPYTDGLNGLSRVCTACGGLGAGLGNSLLKMGSAAADLDSPRSRADGPNMRKSTNLSLMCVGGCRCPRYMSIGIP